MGYRILYDKGSRVYEVRRERPSRFWPMLAGCLAVFLLLTWAFWPEGAEMIQEMLIPGDNAATLEALNTMADNLRSGLPMSQAVSAFCQEILHGA